MGVRMLPELLFGSFRNQCSDVARIGVRMGPEYTTWEQVDFGARTLTISNTKNHQEHVLPLSDFLLNLLNKRKNLSSDSSYVFSGNGKKGYNIEPRKVINKIIAKCNITFTLHDLRRTFITIAESLDIPAYALKRLLNHKTSQDVTAGYIIIDAERLRKPMQQITNHLLTFMNKNC